MLAAFYRGHLHIQKHQKDHEVRLDLFQDQIAFQPDDFEKVGPTPDSPPLLILTHPILDLKACPIDNNCVKQTDDMEYNFGYI